MAGVPGSGHAALMQAGPVPLEGRPGCGSGICEVSSGSPHSQE